MALSPLVHFSLLAFLSATSAVVATEEPTVFTTPTPTVLTTQAPTVFTTPTPTVFTTPTPTVFTTPTPTVSYPPRSPFVFTRAPVIYTADFTLDDTATTLVFVFDTTGSMANDLNQVKDGIAKIIETVLKRKEGLKYNFVLVPFNDPGIGPVLSTTSHTEFQKRINGLTVYGGDDCPEMCMGGIKLALEAAGPKSFIYVFTDATAKDYHLESQVISLIKLKETQVVFVLTGDCDEPTSERYKVYERVAIASSGLVFNLHKSDVDEIMKFIGSSMDPHTRNVNLYASEKVGAGTNIYPVVVNNSIEEIVVSVSGDNLTIEIRDPNDILVKTKDLLKIDKALVTAVKNPIPGTYSVTAGSSSPHTVNVAGSNFFNVVEFTYGFSTVNVTDIRKTNLSPLKGVPTYLIINITENTGGTQFANVDVIGASTKTWATIPLRKIQENVYEATTTFVPPNEIFYLNITGKSNGTGPIVARLSATSIIARSPEQLILTLTTETVVNFGEATSLICNVETSTPFTVQWMRKFNGYDIPIGTAINYTNRSEVRLTFDSVKVSDSGTYICSVKNSDGSVEKSTVLKVKDLLPVIEDIANQTLIPGSQLIVTCKAISNSDVILTWSRLNPIDSSYTSAFLNREGGVKDFGNGTLRLSNVRPSDAGRYRCEARNEAGISHRDINFDTPELPIVTVTQETAVKIGEATRLTCYVETSKPFTVQWMRNVNGSDIPIGSAMNYSNTTDVLLNFDSVNLCDIGTYICKVKTKEGSVQTSTVLEVKDLPPLIDDIADQGLILGSDLVVTCTTKRNPGTRITWTKLNPKDSIYSYEYLKLEPRATDFGNGTLKLSNVNESDAGAYRCEAINEVGWSHKDIHFDKPVPPKAIISKVLSKFKDGKSLAISCNVTGFPEPNVEWFYENEKIKENENITIKNGKLLISKKEIKDESLYRCVASNAAGVDEAVVTILLIC